MRKLFQTTTLRLSLVYLLLVSVAAALTVGYIYWNTTVLLARQMDATIDAEIRGLDEQYQSGGLPALISTIEDRSQTPGSSLYLLTDANGRKLAGNLKTVHPDLWNATGKVEFIYYRPAPGGIENRLAQARVFRLQGGARLIVGRDMEDRRRFDAVVRSAVIGGLAVVVLLGLVGGWLVSRFFLSRIEAVTDTSRTIMSGDMSGRVPVSGSGDELDALAQNLNAMLERIEQLMTGLREVSDNIAHDLKTPLTRLRNRAEAALRSEEASAHRDALEQTIEEADDLIKTFNALLSIARLEAAAVSDTMEDIDLSKLVGDVAELYAPAAEEAGLRIDTDLAGEVMIKGDRQLLGQAIANLLDNAIKYGSAAGAAKVVAVSVRRSAKQAEIVVADHGPGIPAEDRERALKRFVRLEASRSQPGSGLGLSLVAAVARLHGGEVRLEDNRPGLKVVIALPMLGSA